MKNSNATGEEDIKTREEKLAELMVMSPNNISGIDCSLRELVEKSFTERVLWLEDQTKSQLDNIIKQCDACCKCKYKSANKPLNS